MTDASSRSPTDPDEDTTSTTAVSRKTVARFVKSLLLEQEPHVTTPDGRPLYGYRVRGDRYEDLRSRIRFEFSDLMRGPVDEYLAAGFVLYAAETWRRSEDLTRWNKWDVVLETVGRSDTQCIDLYDAVRAGLRWWKRPLVKLGDATRYLATLVCEGGLPLHLVREKGTPFRRYFRQLLAHVRDFGLEQRPLPLVAEREASTLPKSLQQAPVYTLAAALVEQLWAIHKQVKDRVGDPIQLLDKQDPSWRDRMPLRLDDDVARGLLRELIDDVRDVIAHSGSDPRVSRWLELLTSGWVLHARIETPRATSVARFANLFDETAEAVPRCFRLSVNTTGSAHPPFATGYRHDDTVQFEVASVRRAEVEGTEASGQIELGMDPQAAGSGGRRIAPIAGGQPLSNEQPWVFRAPDAETGRATLLADGGCRTRYAEVLVAVPDGVTVEPATDAVWVLRGRTRETQRQLFECRGEVRLRNAEGDQWCVATGQEQDERFECLLSGRRFPHAATNMPETFVGTPRVLHRTDSGVLGLPQSSDIDWRPVAHGSGWRTNFAAALGRCQLRVRMEGETRLVRPVGLLPATFTCRIVPVDATSGHVHLGGLEGATVEVATVPALVTEQRHVASDAIDLLCSAPESPGTLRIRLHWPDRTGIDLVVPAPFRSAHFVTGAGTKCRRDYVSLDDLFAMRAVVVTPYPNEKFTLTGRLQSRRGVGGASLAEANRKLHLQLDLHASGNGVHEAELRHLVEPVRRALRVVDDLDLQVELTVDVHRGARLPRVHLDVQRYASTLHCEYEEGWVAVATASDPIKSRIEQIGVRAFPLWQPKTQEVELPPLPTPSPTWLFDPACRSPGPWMLYGHDSGAPCTRPRLWLVGLPDSHLAQNAHERAVTASPEQAEERLRELYAALVAGTDRMAWEDLEALLQRCENLPASSFATVTGLVSCPTALVLSLLRASHRETFDSVFRLREELAFDWTILPLRCWLDAWRSMLGWTRARYEEKLAAEEVDELVQAKCDKILNFLPGSDRALRLLCNWALASCGPDQRTLPEVQAMRSPMGRKLVREQIATRWMESRRRHANDDWPRMHRIETWVGDLPVALESECAGHAGSPERVAIARAPWIAAGTTLTASAPDPLLTFDLHRARSFDAEWFDVAHEMYLAIAIAHFEQLQKQGANR